MIADNIIIMINAYNMENYSVQGCHFSALEVELNFFSLGSRLHQIDLKVKTKIRGGMPPDPPSIAPAAPSWLHHSPS